LMKMRHPPHSLVSSSACDRNCCFGIAITTIKTAFGPPYLRERTRSLNRGA
jgi:hypothetical protein